MRTHLTRGGTVCLLRRYPQMPSTVIRFFRYHPPKRELNVIFQTGRDYTYEDFPEELYKAMTEAVSKGEFFNEHIRGKFVFRRNG